MRVFFLGQKPVGEMAYNYVSGRVNVVGVCSNVMKTHWWRTANVKHNNFVASEVRDDEALYDAIRKSAADTIISVQYPWIIPDTILDLVEGNAFNLHLAPLPRYKGYNGVSHAILNRDETYGVTIHWITGDVDGGPIAFSKEFPIDPDDTAQLLYIKAKCQGIGILSQLVSALLYDRVPSVEQVGIGTYHKRDSLDPYRKILPCEDVSEKARALYFPPFEPAYIIADGKKFHVIPGGDSAYFSYRE